MRLGTKLILSFVTSAVSVGLFGCAMKSEPLIGYPPDRQKSTANNVQTFQAKVDILFVVDDSGSMESHQTGLAANVEKFVDELKKSRVLDYHIGVISTAEDEGSLGPGAGPGAGRLAGSPKFVSRGTPNGLDLLKKTLMLGTNGSASEMVFKPAAMALSEPNLSSWNAGFFRKGAALALVFITDAEDQSNESRMAAPGLPTDWSPEAFYDFLLNLKDREAQKILTYGAIIPSDETSQCQRDDPSAKPARIEKFFELSKGIALSLCDPDFGVKLSELGKDISRRVGRRVYLEKRPQLETVEIYFGKQRIEPHLEKGWSYDPIANAIYLGKEIEWQEQDEDTSLEIFFDPVQVSPTH